jgi:hypothetical protein
VALVEGAAGLRRVAPQRLDGMAADRPRALAALAGTAYEALLEIDAGSVSPTASLTRRPAP